MADTSGQWTKPTKFQDLRNMMATPENSPGHFSEGTLLELLIGMLEGSPLAAQGSRPGADVRPSPRYQSDGTPVEPAGAGSAPPGMPQGLWDFIAPYIMAEPMTPEQIEAFGTAATMTEMDLAAREMAYQEQFLQLKADELGFSQSQLEQAKKEFAFQSGEYWDWFSNDYFEFQKQIEANQVAMSNNQLAMSNNQVLMSKDDLTRSANATLSSQAQTEAAAYQAQAAKYAAMAEMGLTTNPNAVKSFNSYRMY